MANESELHELKERIARLSDGDQLLIAELILAGFRSRHFTDHEAARQEIAAMEIWHSQRQKRPGSGEVRREAG